MQREQWHQRYLQQARWTQEVRRYLYTQLGIHHAHHILETGCGTGAITAGLHAYTVAQVSGIDINLPHLELASQHDPDSQFAGANVGALPFRDNQFDFVLCHFFLLWLNEPGAGLSEMLRVTRPGGVILILAEPDYGGRMDAPVELEEIGRMQAAALSHQGADPRMGRKVAGLLATAGLRDIHAGLLGGQWHRPPSRADWQAEWEVLSDDLREQLSPGQILQLKQQDWDAWQRGARILFVPTFYAWGTKPG